MLKVESLALTDTSLIFHFLILSFFIFKEKVKFLFCNSSQEDVSEQIGFVFKDMSFVIGFHLFCGGLFILID